MFRKFIENTFNLVKDAVLRNDFNYSGNLDRDIEEVLQIVTEEVQVHLQRMDEQPERRAESQEVVHKSPDDKKCAVESKVVEKYPQSNEGRQGPSVSRSIRDFDEFKISEGETACSLPANRATNSKEENKSRHQSEQNMSSVSEESIVRPNQLPRELSHNIDPIQTDPGYARHIAGNVMDDVQYDPGCDNPIPRHHLAAADKQNEDEGIHLNEEHDHQDLLYRHQTTDEKERFRRLKHDNQDDKSDTVLVIEISTGGKSLSADEPLQQYHVEANLINVQPPVAQGDEANNPEQLPNQAILQPVDQEADQPVIQPDDQEADQPIVQHAGQEAFWRVFHRLNQGADQPIVQPAGQEAVQPMLHPLNQGAGQLMIQPAGQEAAQPADQEADQPLLQLANQDLAQAGPANPQDDNESLPTDDEDALYDYISFNGLNSSEIDDDEDDV